MEKDIHTKDYLVSRLISMGKTVDGYCKLYYQANENLVDFLDVDFASKDVFSVLASSDQVLTARYLEAHKVDAFDFNRLTLNYFYLRIWSLQYKKELYPLVLNGNAWLASLLKLVKPTSEQELKALEFFKKHLRDHTNISNLFYDIDAQPIGKTLYTKPEELEGCLDPNLTFYHIDLFKPVELPNTYDIAPISNILDWARGDVKKLEIARDNLSRLLKKDGIIICSNLVNRDINKEREVFSDFEFNQNGSTYTYQKR